MSKARKRRRPAETPAAAAAETEAHTDGSAQGALPQAEQARAEAQATAPDTAPSPANDVGQMIDTLLTVDGDVGRIDADAAAAAVDVVNVPNNVPAGPDASAGAAAPVARPDFHRWSKTRVQKASRKQLAAYVRELEAEVERTPVPAAAGDPIPLGDIAAMEHTLRGVLPGVNEGVAFLAGESFRHDDEQQELLVKGLAPSLAPHYDRLRVTLPWLPAGLAVLGVYLPKVFEHLRQEKLRKATTAEVQEQPTTPSLALVPEPPPPAAAPHFARPFGGPAE